MTDKDNTISNIQNDKIGKWLNKQLKDYKKGKLSTENLNELRQLPSFNFWLQCQRNITVLNFEQMLKLCKEYENVNGIIYKHVIHNDVKIGNWLYTQIKKTKKDKLTQMQTDSLKELLTIQRIKE